MPPDDEDEFKDYKDNLKQGDRIDLSRFTQRVSQKNQKADFRDPKTGWKISPDRSSVGHGGSGWKLINAKGQRVGTLTKDGKFLRYP